MLLPSWSRSSFALSAASALRSAAMRSEAAPAADDGGDDES